MNRHSDTTQRLPLSSRTLPWRLVNGRVRVDPRLPLRTENCGDGALPGVGTQGAVVVNGNMLPDIALSLIEAGVGDLFVGEFNRAVRAVTEGFGP